MSSRIRFVLFCGVWVSLLFLLHRFPMDANANEQQNTFWVLLEQKNMLSVLSRKVFWVCFSDVLVAMLRSDGYVLVLIW